MSIEIQKNIQYAFRPGNHSHVDFMQPKKEIGRLTARLVTNFGSSELFGELGDIQIELQLGTISYDQRSTKSITIVEYNNNLSWDGYIEMFQRCIVICEENNWNFVPSQEIAAKYNYYMTHDKLEEELQNER